MSKGLVANTFLYFSHWQDSGIHIMLGRCDIDPISSIDVYCIELYNIIFSSHDHECMITQNCLRVVPGSEGKLNSETQGCSPIFLSLSSNQRTSPLIWHGWGAEHWWAACEGRQQQCGGAAWFHVEDTLLSLQQHTSQPGYAHLSSTWESGSLAYPLL
jgi:hypothetical protein